MVTLRLAKHPAVDHVETFLQDVFHARINAFDAAGTGDSPDPRGRGFLVFFEGHQTFFVRL
jgi:hypothetical protein